VIQFKPLSWWHSAHRDGGFLVPKLDCHIEMASNYRPIGVVRRLMKHTFRDVGGIVEEIEDS
jgi:hypothetical protein